MLAQSKMPLRSRQWSCSALVNGSREVMRVKKEQPVDDDLDEDEQKVAEEIKAGATRFLCTYQSILFVVATFLLPSL